MIVAAATLGTAAIAAPHHAKGFIGAAAARRDAVRAVHGRALTAGLENEDGKMEYSVMVKSGATMHEVMIDARTGKLASQETVTAGEEARESRAEAKESKTLKRASKVHSRAKRQSAKTKTTTH